MTDWIPVVSDWVRAIAYDEPNERILVEFHDGVRWWYGECPPGIWEEFNSPGTSKGQYIHSVLNGHPYGRHEG